MTTARDLEPYRYPSMRVAYAHLANHVLSYGSTVSPRGQATRELLGATFAIEDATDCLATGTERKLNTKFAAADALQVIGGFSDHEWASRFNPRIAEYGEHGAYGPRIAHQMDAALDRLRADRDSRRAVVAVWQYEKDLRYREDATDFPCTTQLQLMIRDGRLDAHVSMRANDLWWGTPYDVFTFSQLQCTAAALLGVEPGTYYHHATSLHLYEKDFDAAAGLRVNLDPPADNRPLGLTGPWLGEIDNPTWAAIGRAAGHIAYSQELIRDWAYEAGLGELGSIAWYAEKLA